MTKRHAACTALLGAVLTGCIGDIATDLPAPPIEPGSGDSTEPGLGGSSGAAPGTGGTQVSSPSCTANAWIASPVRRLTRWEYNNTVRDLLGDTTAPAKAFVVDGKVGLFENNASAPISVLAATQYGQAAETLAARAVQTRLSTLAPCASSATTTAAAEACAESFIADFGKRAYRRPLTAAERTRLMHVYTSARTALAYDFAGGLRVVVQTMLQSPSFLHHIEIGRPARAGDRAVALTPHELAARLSYFLWGTMPDQELLAAADAARLSDVADIEAQVSRMLAHARARAGLVKFLEGWLDLAKLDGLTKSAALFPAWNEALRVDLRRETEAFWNHVVWDGDGKLTTLLTAPLSFLNSRLASLYDVAGVASDSLRQTALDPSRRAGLLTQGSLLALNAHSDSTSPVHRGLLVRMRLMCQEPPPPPPNVDISLPVPPPGVTVRESLTQRTADPYCAGCHQLMNPIGFGFEGYDAIGRFRTTEAGKPVDTSGEILSSADADGKFAGVVELANKLAASRQVQDCFASQLMSYGTAVAGGALGCHAGIAADAYVAAGTDIRKLLVAITTSEGFRQRPVTAVQEVCP